MSLIFLDIDGTLYSHATECIPSSADHACREAHKKGHHLFLSTGRSVHQIREFLALDYIDGAVSSNGAYCLIAGKTIDARPLEEKSVEKLMKAIEKYHTGVSMQSEKENWLNEESCRMIIPFFMKMAHTDELHARRMMEERMQARDIRTRGHEPVYKCDVYFNEGSDADGFVSSLDPDLEWSPMLSEADGDARGGEITAHGITKAHGAGKISEAMHIPLSDAYAFGDGMNDIDLIEACGHGIAMGNGKTALKKKSDYITEDADHDGIRNAFLHFGIL